MLFDNIIITFLIIAIIVLFVALLRSGHKYQVEKNEKEYLKKRVKQIRERFVDLKQQNKLCRDIKFADENVFAFVRCINQPKKEICKKTPDGNQVCRSRLVECSKFRMILEQDPVSMARLQLATYQ